GDDLVEGLHHGAGALRRRRRRPPDPRLGTADGLAARGPVLRTALACPPRPSRPLRVPLTRRARRGSRVADARAARAPRGRARSAGRRGRHALPGHAAVALPVSPRPRRLGLARRPGPSDRPDDAAAGESAGPRGLTALSAAAREDAARRCSPAPP